MQPDKPGPALVVVVLVVADERRTGCSLPLSQVWVTAPVRRATRLGQPLFRRTIEANRCCQWVGGQEPDAQIQCVDVSAEPTCGEAIGVLEVEAIQPASIIPTSSLVVEIDGSHR